MPNAPRIILYLLLALFLVSCGNDPGPLEGTWHMSGLIPMTVTFRDGEEEAMGLISRVSYRMEGNDVLVTYEDGLAKGTTMRYKVLGPDTVRTELGVLRRAGTTGPNVKQINQRKRQEITDNTICAYNSDTDKCSCYHKQNGLKVLKTKSECIEWARSGR